MLKDNKRIFINPLDIEIIERSVEQTSVNKIRNRQIVSTALVVQSHGNSVVLITCDQNVYAANLITIIW